MEFKTVRALLFCFMLLFIAGFAEAYEKMVIGVIEKVTFMPEKVTLSAKLDTGAKSSSLGVTDMKIFEKDHEQWVHFVVHTKSNHFYFERKLEGYVKIKARHSENKISESDAPHKSYISRPVVLMNIKLGDREEAVYVNLANRKNFIYPFLLGRDAIIKLGQIIDPTQKFTLRTKTRTN